MAGAKILIVDDERLNRRVIERRLLRDGYTVLSAENGLEALAVAEAEQPDLVLLDVMMPEMDGFETCQRLRETAHGRATPVIMVTALADRDNRVRGLDAGADEFLTKPVDSAELSIRVASLLRLAHFQRLAAQRELLAAAVQDLEDGVVVLEAGWRVVGANRRARHLLNLGADVDAGLDLAEHLARFEVDPPLAALLPSGGEEAGFDIVRRGEPPLVVEGRLSAVHGRTGEGAVHALVLRDVTAERHAERLRADFLSLTAHKIRTPLTVLRGLVELCADERGRLMMAALLPEVLPDVARKLAELEAIVADLMDARRQPMAGALSEPETPLGEAVDAALAAVASSHPGPELSVEAQPRGLVVPMAAGDLELVLRELFENAVKFAADQPPAVTLTGEAANGVVHLTLTDNGRGIPHEHFDRVFSECFQVEDKFTGEVPGMGLGLAMVRRVVAAYGGSADIVASELGRGTTFSVTVPQPRSG